MRRDVQIKLAERMHHLIDVVILTTLVILAQPVGPRGLIDDIIRA
jgi:hypothetical protein